MLYISGDHHLAHTNILDYCKRPFKSITHHDMELVRRWNEVVKPEDLVIHLGDFCFERGEQDHRYWRSQLNGDIIFIQGNHDSHKNAPIQSLIFKYGGIDWWCSHYPERRYKHNLCAHVHSLWKTRKTGTDIIINCGVDAWNFTPVSMEQIMETVRSAPNGESK